MLSRFTQEETCARALILQTGGVLTNMIGADYDKMLKVARAADTTIRTLQAEIAALKVRVEVARDAREARR